MPDRLAEGHAREREARLALERAGLKLRAANVRYPVGELDLVMDDGAVLVFVEVRYRRANDYGGGADTVTSGKQRKVARAASAYLAANPQLARRTCRFDVVAIGHDGVQWIRDAFQAGGWT